MTIDDALRPASEIPRATPLQMVRNILSQGRGRLDMYSGLDRLYRQHNRRLLGGLCPSRFP